MADGAGASPRKGPRVLVIEDNASIAECLRSILVAVGYDAVVAATGQAGLTQIRNQRPAVVLLDLHLPDMHGGAVLKSLRADGDTKTTPVIVITSSEKISDVLNAVSFGANDYMTKPFDSTTLVTKVSQYARAPAAR